MNRRSAKYNALAELVMILVILVIINVISTYLYQRFDLTKEKRFTLSRTSEEYAKKLDDKLTVKIFLEGEDLTPDLKRMKIAVKDMMEEFRRVSGGKLEYEFEDPFAGHESSADQSEIFKQLTGEGLIYQEFPENKKQAKKLNGVFPSAIFYYKTIQKVPLNFVKQGYGDQVSNVVNQSIENLEFEIANVLRRLTSERSKRVAFLTGHGEISGINTFDIRKTLEANYTVEELNFSDSIYSLMLLDSIGNVTDVDSAMHIASRAAQNKLRSYDLLVIAKPRIDFNTTELYRIDQYVMNGGKVIWLVDALNASNDSLTNGGEFYAVDYPLENINTLLFRYGVRVNPDLVSDLESKNEIQVKVPVNEREMQTRNLPWVYYPVVNGLDKHRVSRNIEPVWLRYASSIDTLTRPGTTVTPLLQTSFYTKLSSNPVFVTMKDLRRGYDPNYFNKPNRIVAALIEGEFKSAFENRSVTDKDNVYPFRSRSPKNSMVVVGDGDLIFNEVRGATGAIFPCEYDRWTSTRDNQKFFGNKKFFVNCVDHLLDPTGIIEVRNKEIKLRILNEKKVAEQGTRWAYLNIIIPPILVFLFGIINYYLRKRKYAK